MSSPEPRPRADAPPLELGVVIANRYRLESVLGRGGMGCVYRAEHTGIGRPVAVKVLNRTLAGEDATQRFKREAIAAGRLEHPNVVGVSDFGVLDDGSCYLVMEVLEGESLADRLKRQRPLPWTEAVDITCAVLRGLRHAHERGVVHRDIKPDNIFLANHHGNRVVKVLDFGIAKLVAGDALDPARTQLGTTMGTPAYLSPEQAVGGEITPASDLYSATVVLFEMLTGRPPFDDPDLLKVMMAHVAETPPTLASVAPSLDAPPQLEAIVQHGLQKRTVDRIASATAYLELFDGLPRPQVATGLSPAPHSTAPALESVAPSLPPRRETLATAPAVPRGWVRLGGLVVGCAIVLAIVLAIALSGSGSRAPASSDPFAGMSEPAIDAETQRAALLHDLAHAASCAERRATIPKLVALGDARAIAALEAAAAQRGRGARSNACLADEARAAAAALRRRAAGAP